LIAKSRANYRKSKTVSLPKIMELLAFFIWILSALAIPLILIVTSYFKYIQQVEIFKVIFKFFIALVAYIPITIFSSFFFWWLD
jgi:magnesium-transporting ATPase (P-type)